MLVDVVGKLGTLFLNYISLFFFVSRNLLAIRIFLCSYVVKRVHIGKLAPLAPICLIISALIAMLVPPSDGTFYLLRGDARLHSTGTCRMDGLVQLPGLHSPPAEVLSEGEHGACAAAFDVGMGVEEKVDDGVHVGGIFRPVAQVKCLGDGILQVSLQKVEFSC